MSERLFFCPSYTSSFDLYLFLISQLDLLSLLSSWLSVTEIDRLFRSGRALSLDHLSHYHAFHLLLPRSSSPPLQDFLNAYALVSSRAFYIDNFHSLALVPLADLFNHSDEPDVVFLADDVVCPHCGSLPQCLHDHPHPPSQSPLELVHHDTVDLETLRSLVPLSSSSSPSSSSSSQHDQCTSCQVYNSYGQLGNARLLVEYGFMLDANAHDRLSFDLAQIMSLSPSLLKRLGDMAQIFNPSAAQVEPDNELIAFDPEEPLAWQSRFSPDDHLWIDASARLSPLLWLALVCQLTAHHPAALNGLDSHLDLVLDLLRFQLASPLTNPLSFSHPSQDLFSFTVQLAQSTQKVCEARLATMHRADLSVDQLLELKEDPSFQLFTGQNEAQETHLKMLIDYLASERLLLESCCTRWSQLVLDLDLSEAVNCESAP